ncbi:hypothetical protein BJ742DRAFT_812800 [Cladochytrium replicatum]|nr:hypothetical protein BJ742DRAFT_812800 [Cladochytrium replicatum]
MLPRRFKNVSTLLHRPPCRATALPRASNRYTTMASQNLPHHHHHPPQFHFMDGDEVVHPFSLWAWSKALAVVALGITGGVASAIVLNKALGEDGLDVFTYRPDDEDDDDDDGAKEEGVGLDRGSLFYGSDFRLSLPFLWNRMDESYQSLAKERIEDLLEELDQIEKSKRLDGLNEKELRLIKRFLEDTQKLNQERTKEIQARKADIDRLNI